MARNQSDQQLKKVLDQVVRGLTGVNIASSSGVIKAVESLGQSIGKDLKDVVAAIKNAPTAVASGTSAALDVLKAGVAGASGGVASSFFGGGSGAKELGREIDRFVAASKAMLNVRGSAVSMADSIEDEVEAVAEKLGSGGEATTSYHRPTGFFVQQPDGSSEYRSTDPSTHEPRPLPGAVPEMESVAEGEAVAETSSAVAEGAGAAAGAGAAVAGGPIGIGLALAAGAAYLGYNALNGERGASKSSGFVGSIEAGATEITQSAAGSISGRDEGILTRWFGGTAGVRDRFFADRALGGIR